MHIPDGLLDIPVSTATSFISAGSLFLIWRKLKKQFTQHSVPQMALLAAFIFVAQMINIPVSGGTSGHLLGGLLAALLLGPFTGIFIMSLVIMVQALFFQDGGITALGANILNIAIAGTGSGYLVYNYLSKRIKKSTASDFPGMVILFFAAWLSVEVGAVLCALELSLAGSVPWKLAVGLMSTVHALIGFLEGLLTLFIFKAVRSIRPDLIYVLR
ncbi:MAG: energy-coupling factor ABC transporter permease [Calditrichia bacterium]